MMLYNLGLKEQITRQIIPPLKPVHFSAYPLMTTTITPEISAESAIILDDTSKVLVYQKKPALRFSMASTTKIMTALVGLEHYRLDAVLTVKTASVEGSFVGFVPGEQVRFADVLYGMMLPSGNDAAFTVADNYPGGLPGFVQAMNAKAASLGLTYTHYVDPAGLDDDGNYTTATDLARLASYALRNREFAKIVSTKEKTITDITGTHIYKLDNLNKLLGENGVTGIKTGFTEGAGEVLVTSKVEQGHVFIIVVMKSLDRFSDTQTLLALISNNVNFIDPLHYITSGTKQ
jgi:D-alanyl-D-alanine carboxypeptidase